MMLELAEESMSDVLRIWYKHRVDAAMRKNLILKSLKNSRQLSFREFVRGLIALGGSRRSGTSS